MTEASHFLRALWRLPKRPELLSPRPTAARGFGNSGLPVMAVPGVEAGGSAPRTGVGDLLRFTRYGWALVPQDRP